MTCADSLFCGVYEFGPTFGEYAAWRYGTPPQHLIDVVLVASLDRGVTFSLRESVSDTKWNPAINAPWAHGDPEVTFIGEYFGLNADKYPSGSLVHPLSSSRCRVLCQGSPS